MAAPKLHTTVPVTARAKGKRPRPSDSSLVGAESEPATAVRRKDGMTSTAGPLTPGLGDSAHYRKGMYLAFIDDAFASRDKGRNDRYNELVAQFRSLLPSSGATSGAAGRPTASTSATSTTPAPTSPQLRSWLEALTHVVSKLDKSHTPLVETILAIPWATLEEHVVGAYMRFVGALVSARTEWLRSVLDKCVRGFKYKSNYTSSTSTTSSITRRTLYARLHALLRLLISLVPTLASALSPLLASHFPPKRDPCLSQICYIDNLLILTEYCPALVEDVLGLVIERALGIDVEIQGESDDWDELEEEEAADGKGKKPVGSVAEAVDRFTADDEDSSDDEAVEGAVEDSDDESEEDEDEEEEREAAREAKKKGVMSLQAMQKARDNSIKLDAILKVVFDHLAGAHSHKVKPAAVAEISSPPPPTTKISAVVTVAPNEAAELTGSAETTPTPELPPSAAVIARRLSLFRTLLDIFDRTLLRTFKTRHTQFLLFYLCSLDPASSDHFIGVLLGRAVFETEAPAVTRVAAAGYIASFVARASFVDAGMTRKVVRLLCEFLEVQMDAQASGKATGSQHLPVFYAVAQAVFYIFCFRWKDLLDEVDEDDIVLEPGRRWMMGLETLKRAVSSSFNPLKVCAPSVVTQFATIAHKTNFLYCYAIIDANQRQTSARESFSLPQPTRMSTLPALHRSVSDILPLRPRVNSPFSSATASPAAPVPRQLLVAEEMDSFFPFDPLKLPLSSIYIDGIYSHWVADDEGTSSETSSSASSDSGADDDESSSEVDTDTEAEFFAGSIGLAVPGMRKDDGTSSFEDDVSRSFEAMSLSPEHSAFGGRGSLPMPGITI